MHRLVYEKDGLPNGSEVAYFSQGKVVEFDVMRACLWLVVIILFLTCWTCWQKLLEGYKTETGIYCLCCNSDVSLLFFFIKEFIYGNKWICKQGDALHPIGGKIIETGVSLKCKSFKRNIILLCTMSRLVHPSSKHTPAGHHDGSRTSSSLPLIKI